jgi:CRISPR system Cascade subunit CasD
MDSYLLLWLEGPLQAWGYDSRFGRRETLEFPTKSGVFGLVCCALGAAGPQRELLAELAELDMRIVAYVRKDRRGNPAPRETLLRDFQMVGNGYDDRDPWQSLLIPKTDEGKKAVGGGSKLTHRFYLQDMAFAVALQVPEGMAGKLVEALENPVWDLYLGRKNCAPTEFICQGCFDTAESALETAAQLAEQKNRTLSFSVHQGEKQDGRCFSLNDVPIQFGERKRYRERLVTVYERPADDG